MGKNSNLEMLILRSNNISEECLKNLVDNINEN